MSGFDEPNPFGEPMVNDPFADPAVLRAVNSTPANTGIEDYNPFAETHTQNTSQIRGAANPPLYGGMGATPIPATLRPSNQDPPPPEYTRTPQQVVNEALSNVATSPTSTSMADDEELRARRGRLHSELYNWPPLPAKCCCQPCFYQDIDIEIHANFQKVVRHLYYLWIFHGCVMLLNCFGGLILLLAEGDATTFGLALLYLILFTPFSFLCWFRPAYRAFKNDSSFFFMVFFFVFFFQLIVTTIQALGIHNSGTCGLLVAITSFGKSPTKVIIGILMLIITLGFVAAALGDLLLLTKIHRIYRSSGASVSKAQQEFAATFLRSEHVQNAATNIAANAVRTQMANAAQQAQQPRY
ncbi:secretory carrier-associated membrane protein 5A [Prorops nasuta]|uniref:secretory carrier-associated membrane protein 5A n=1 Tax=Prorops nasuta TaxID=863751 RepID=UPI0034D0133F